MCNAWNHSPECNCGWGGAWYGNTGGGGWGGGNTGGGVWGGSFSYAIGHGDPETRLISCWWCGAAVYYHSNGWGDSVLFDGLGKPWPVHECWQKYKNDIQQSEIRIRINRLESWTRSFFEVPTSTSLKEQITGYIVDNHVFHQTPETFTFLVDDYPAGYQWVYLDVSDSQGRYFRFLIPTAFALAYKNHSLIEIDGKWIHKGGRLILFTTKISKISYPSGEIETKQITKATPTKLKAQPKKIKFATRVQLLEIRKSSVEIRKPRNPQAKLLKKQPPILAIPKDLDHQTSKRTSRRTLALSMYKKGASLEKIAKALDIKAEAHVLQMILKAAIQAVKDSKEKPVEESVARMLGLSIKEFRQKFGHLYKVEPEGIKLKEPGIR
ncbi:MAG TPA: hypothetical protein IGS53_02645 [Leptolyngbyaceae cyanobacterium M33_DOE_097]|uniref:Uncharacterized protein n=1 Tax=Oscillatoriales cyanobacterium SpSt-418 TaxID=2282169 RepID=A0A7C3KER5_9CYAN|nr:hypothetical protein [Leptolyngbyaceae cyanobacterium M33_DOE_097]